MYLETALFIVLAGIIIFLMFYFLLSSIKIPEETNKYVLVFVLFIILMMNYYGYGSLNDILKTIIFLEAILIIYYRLSFDSILFGLGILVVAILDFLLFYNLPNLSQTSIFSYLLGIAAISFTAFWAIILVEKRTGRRIISKIGNSD